MSRKMYKIVLEKQGRIVGDLGEFETKREALMVQSSFNTKTSRRGVIARIEAMKKNPSNIGLLFMDDSKEDEQDEDSEYSSIEENPTPPDFFFTDSEESEESEESEDSEESEYVFVEEKPNPRPQSIYKNPLDLLPIDRKIFKSQERILPPPNPIVRQNALRGKTRAKRYKAPYEISVQAVMIDDDGYVLIRKPSNKFRGISWEFYGGKAKGGEDIEQALRREVEEETGYTLRLVDKIGEISLDGGFQKFFLVAPDREIGDPQIETDHVYWVSQDEAWEMLGKNKEPYKRKLRQILDKSFSIWRRK